LEGGRRGRKNVRAKGCHRRKKKKNPKHGKKGWTEVRGDKSGNRGHRQLRDCSEKFLRLGKGYWGSLGREGEINRCGLGCLPGEREARGELAGEKWYLEE